MPKFALPVLAYWGIAGAITYQLLHWHDRPEAPLDAQLAAFAPPTEPARSWSQAPVNAPAFEAAPAPALHAQPPDEPVVPPNDEAPSAAESSNADGELAGDGVVASSVLRRAREPSEPEFGAVPDRSDRPKKQRHRELGDLQPSDIEAPPSPSFRSVSRQSIPAPDLFALSPLAPAARGSDTASAILDATPPDAPSAVANALPSCESAAASANQEMNLAERDGTPDLSREAIARVLDNGVWIARCDIPMNTTVDLCVAIQRGKVIGVSAASRPASAAINACVRRRAAGLSFPFSARVDIARTHF
ncbi:MAG TPA: hypothetical protein VHV51_05280 [Polyangiaceae bacterium]|jgi:hypothetical protein|nr:hypothetical protein [Polyangiaceae bacterium]